jgi:hypothetical protein
MHLSSLRFPFEFAAMASTNFLKISGIGLNTSSSEPSEFFGTLGNFDQRFEDVRAGTDLDFSGSIVALRLKWAGVALREARKSGKGSP